MKDFSKIIDKLVEQNPRDIDWGFRHVDDDDETRIANVVRDHVGLPYSVYLKPSLLRPFRQIYGVPSVEVEVPFALRDKTYNLLTRLDYYIAGTEHYVVGGRAWAKLYVVSSPEALERPNHVN